MRAQVRKKSAPSQVYFKRHYFEKIFAKGWSFSGFERDKVFLNNGEGRFVDVSGISGADSPTDGRGVAFGDYDNDGDVDVFLHTIQKSRHLLFRNDVGNRRNWVRVELEGTRSNRDGIGAIVTLSQGDKRLARVAAAGTGYLSSHDHRLLFGLDRAERAERIEVAWPSGERQVIENVPAGTSVRIREGEPGYETVAYRRVAFADPPPAVDEDVPLVAAGDTFPELALTGLDGRPVELESFRSNGEPVLVNFWATWCTSCRHEMPVLERLAQDYRSCVKVVGVSLDLDENAQVERFLKDKKITYPVVLTDEESPLKVFREDKVLLPASFLVDKTGKVEHVFVGGSEETLDELEGRLRESCRL